MDKDKKFPLNKKLIDALANMFFESLVINGDLTKEDLKDPEKIKQKALKIINKEDFSISIVVDHTLDLLKTARNYKKARNFEYARLFYATFFEHSINDVIQKTCMRKGLDQKTKSEILKQVNLDGKFTWLLQLLGLPKFRIEHYKIIRALSNERNAFVHYKFNYEKDEVPNLKREDERIISEFVKIEKAAKYINTYRTKILFNGQKSQIKNFVKGR